MTGRRLLQFEVFEKLGEGGMGAVYHALDTRLNRHVAIKVLPSDRLSDSDRKRRFIQEAQTASALNHPNIVTIHDVAADGEAQFIVMELVPGRTLAECIGRKPLPLPEALRYAVQVADALTAAHAAGIIHRDLKPGNIMVTGNGLVKVLDFGLAKLTEQIIASDSTPTVTLEPPITNPGTIVGTASYMSPEQAEGRPADARSDIFSFGAVLYEMLSGRRAFTGESQMAILSAVLRAEPKPLLDLMPGIPTEMDRAVSRCLRKEPDRRFQTMADLKVVLQEWRDESDSGRLTGAIEKPLVSRRRKWLWPAIGAVCLLAAGGVGIWMGGRPGGPTPRLMPLTSFPGIESNPSLSPDGTQVAFAWNGEKEDNFDIYVKQIDGEGFTRLTTDPAPEGTPRWSPDGRSIVFFRSGKDPAVMLIPAIGGPARRLPENRFSHGWTPDSKSLLIQGDDGVSGFIALGPVEGGQVRQLTFPPKSIAGDASAAVSPDGHTLAFFRAMNPSRPDVFTMPMTGGEPRPITTGLGSQAGLCWTPDGKEIVFSSDRGSGHRLWRVPAGASPDRAPELVEFAGEDATQPQIAGSRLVYTKRHVRTNLWRTALDGKQTEPTRILASTRVDHHAVYSPDGRRIAFQSDRTGVTELWVATSEGDNPVRLTNLAVTGGPVWSPDSKSIAFGARATGQTELYVVSAEGGTPRRIGKDGPYPQSWSRDGKWIYGLMNVGTLEIFKIHPEGGEPVRVTRNGGFHAQESADGRYLLYTKLPNIGGTQPSSFWKMPVDGGEEVQLHDGIYAERWQPSGTGIYFLDFQNFRRPEYVVYFLDIETREAKRVVTLSKASGTPPGFTINPDGRWMITTHSEPPVADIMLVDNFR